MTETKLLDNTLELIDENGTLKAYEYLQSNLSKDEEWSSQVYNFLYCLAATSDKPDEALVWMEEAIIDKSLWYRPEVFEDDDLEIIRNEERFIVCEETSRKRYMDALETATTEFTWKEKLEDNLIIVLHGNQQNNRISREFWSGVGVSDYQIEYLQSKEIDSYKLYRWNEDGDGPKQLASSLNAIDYDSYSRRVLAGFSAGCNTILRAIATENVVANKVLLLSPWMPTVEEFITEIIECLKKSAIEVVIVCGESDDDCLPHCKMFEAKAKELDFGCTIRYIEGLAHEYPDDFSSLIREYLLVV